jgi:membrane fusion protein, heavy metal efflux system
MNQPTLGAAAVLVALGLACAGCDGRDGASSTPRSTATTATADRHAHEPGETHENAARPAGEAWCGEHGVPEATCTKCDPSRIPAFKAKGDWCAEHGFPMSVCPIHHPAKPPEGAAVETDEAPADRTMIRFRSLETARRSGLETVAAVEGTGAAGITVPALIVADASGHARVNAPASGVVRKLLVNPGSMVSVGTPLAVLASSEVGAARAGMRSARARADVAQAAYERQKELHEKGMIPLRELQSAEEEWETARSATEAAAATLSMMGVTDRDLGAGGADGTYLVRAPIRGTLTASLATVGSLVNAEEALFEIVDASRLWAEIDVPERQAYLVEPGQRVVLRVDGLPGTALEGAIHSVAPVIDPHTRCAKARARITSKAPALRANMYARATIHTRIHEGTVLVPSAAVQEAKGVRLVFVKRREDQYETRRVEATPADGGMVAISSGIRVGESVVTTGSFLLKTETLKGSIGTGCCEVEPRGR